MLRATGQPPAHHEGCRCCLLTHGGNGQAVIQRKSERRRAEPNNTVYLLFHLCMPLHPKFTMTFSLFRNFSVFKINAFFLLLVSPELIPCGLCLVNILSVLHGGAFELCCEKINFATECNTKRKDTQVLV